MHQRDSLEIDLDSKITPRDHYRLGCGHNAVDVLDGLVFFNLRDDRNVSTTVFDDLLAGEDVVGSPDEAQSNRINALFQTDDNVLSVFLREGIRVNFRSRQVDAFVRAELAADDDSAVNIGRNDFFDSQFDLPVGEQDWVSDLHFVRQAFERNRCALAVARDAIGSQDEFLSRLQLDESIFDGADADLRSLQILKNRQRLIQCFSNAFDLPNQIALILDRPMREIQSRHIHARRDQLGDHFFGIRYRTDGANNFCSAHHFFESLCIPTNRSIAALTSGAPGRMR